MLEKAYAAAHYKGSYEASLRGGKPREALIVLTGLVDGFISNDLYAYSEAKGLKVLETLFETGDGTPYVKHYRDGNPTAIAGITSLKKTVLGNNDSFLDQWLAFNKDAHMKARFDKLYAEHGSPVKKKTAVLGGADYSSELRRNVLRAEQFVKWFRKETVGLAPGVVHAVISFVTDETVFSGKRGTGIYTDENIEAWTNIETALSMNQPVTAGTYKETGASHSAIKGTVGESVSKGLVGSHMYTILGVAEDRAHPELRWVKLRNPWGQMVRAYVRSGEEKSNLKPVEVNISLTGKPPSGEFIKPESETQSVVGLARQGVFWMELSDFAKRFSNIQSGATLPRARR
jgi:hypothetical protein